MRTANILSITHFGCNGRYKMFRVNVGDKIIAKKNHACGGNEWLVARTGADIKLKCIKCGHSVFLSVDKVNKIITEVVHAVKDDSQDV